jgi:hypothetical protein
MTVSQGLRFEFANWQSLALIIFIFLGWVAWLTYIAISVHRLKKHVVTREEMTKAFEDFKKEIRRADQ